MKIGIVIPVVIGSRRGNEITALRWQALLTEMGHEVVVTTWQQQVPDVDGLIALNAVRTQASVREFKQKYPDRPVVVCLTGTDLHGVFDDDSGGDDENRVSSTVAASPGQYSTAEFEASETRRLAESSLRLAERIILLEPRGMRKLPRDLQSRCVVIFQSAEPWENHGLEKHEQVTGVDKNWARQESTFDVSLIGHLRHQKDPMLAAEAIRRLPVSSKIRLIHVGEILEDRYRAAVERELAANRRYRWLGKLDHQAALQVLVDSRLTLLTSRHEGAPSIISEAIVNGVPLLATRIDATIGMLGDDYPGLFDVGDVATLTTLLLRFEQDPDFGILLKQSLDRRRRRFTRAAERESWKALLASIH